MEATEYPGESAAQSAWIRRLRGPRPEGDVWRAHSWFIESERSADGRIEPGLTVLLRSRECPWRCLMCDLWRFTVNQRIPRGAIAAQLARVVDEIAQDSRCPELRQIKLYNGGSFFDAAAVPPADHDAVAVAVRGFRRVIVECHPALVPRRAARFRDRLGRAAGSGPAPLLEVAMGLETVHPVALDRLNKRMTLDGFRRAAEVLRDEGIALRAFVLVQPPFVPEAEALDWSERSVAFAMDCGATVVTLIPTRAGNGALEALAGKGHFSQPVLSVLERALARGLAAGPGRVFADLWDLERFSVCAACFPARRARLEAMNLGQRQLEPIRCPECAGPTAGLGRVRLIVD